MEPFHVAHLVALGMWLGVVITEVLFEFSGWVFQRRQIEDVNVLLGFRRRIWTLAAVAAVFATPALYLGLIYFRE
jgi:hypothetical protein